VPRASRTILLTLALALFAGSAVACDDLRGTPIVFAVDWQTQVKPIISEMFPSGRCTSCHNSGKLDGGLDLTDEGIDAIYKLVPAYVEPGAPELSMLFHKINCDAPLTGGSRMPFSQQALTLEQQGLIHDWIRQGALGEPDDEPPIAREFVFRDGVEALR
jgi:hypothetical protein